MHLIILCLFAKEMNAQTYTQTFVDKCSGQIKTATTTMVNGNAVVSFYDQVKVFSPLGVQCGAVRLWLNSVYLSYSTVGCPTNIVFQQTVQQAVTQAASQAATSAATQAASTAASSAAS